MFNLRKVALSSVAGLAILAVPAYTVYSVNQEAPVQVSIPTTHPPVSPTSEYAISSAPPTVYVVPTQAPSTQAPATATTPAPPPRIVVVPAPGQTVYQQVTGPTRTVVKTVPAPPLPTPSKSPAATKDTIITYYGVDGQNAFDLLRVDHTVVYTTSSYGPFVKGIDGYTPDYSKTKEFWGFYVNGQLSNVGAGSYTTKAGDVLMWKIDTCVGEYC